MGSERADKIDKALRGLTRGTRADYLFPTKTAAAAVGCVPSKFGDWWYRNKRKLIALYQACPGEFTAEIATLIALAESERQRREES